MKFLVFNLPQFLKERKEKYLFLKHIQEAKFTDFDQNNEFKIHAINNNGIIKKLDIAMPTI
jgi:hypothetical protein